MIGKSDKVWHGVEDLPKLCKSEFTMSPNVKRPCREYVCNEYKTFIKSLKTWKYKQTKQCIIF